jgi:class 3 adenylate cyclase/alpha-beta hydrolase superfamily lysophospholipase
MQQPRVQFCTTSDGVKIAYTVVGSGPPLVLVPGWVSHLELNWENPEIRARSEVLAQDFTVVSYDKRGTGLSDRDVDDYALEPRLLDLEAVVDRMGFERYAVRGQSEGGPVAIAHAVAHTDRVSHLVLLGTYAHLGRSDASDALVNLIAAEWGLGSATMTNIFMPSATKEQQGWFVRYQREAATREGAAAMLRANLETDVRDLLERVEAPTLVIHSEEDVAVPFHHARHLAKTIPNASLVKYKGDHAAFSAYGEINALMRDFILGDAPAAGAPAALPASGLLTIMFTDIERNTELLARLGDAAWRGLLREHEGITRDLLKRHGGAEIKTIGDAFMASFGSASNALECAIALQRAFAARNATAAVPIRVRVGLNTGEPIAEDGDLFGASVTMASRICGKAEPEQILAANVVRELAAGKRFLFADHGDVVLRGFEDPVRLYELNWSAELR